VTVVVLLLVGEDVRAASERPRRRGDGGVVARKLLVRLDLRSGDPAAVRPRELDKPITAIVANADPMLETPPAERASAAGHARPRLALADDTDDTPSQAAPPRRVLVADDEPAMRVLCRVNLQIEGVDVLEARDGSEALEIATRERPDLVLLDVMMPGIDGWDVARRLAQGRATRRIPILFMTALAGSDDRRRGFEAGGVGYIVKPFDPIQLGEKGNRTLELLDKGDRDRLRREMLDGA
jgi:CheY-like chemotaxis protein